MNNGQNPTSGSAVGNGTKGRRRRRGFTFPSRVEGRQQEEVDDGRGEGRAGLSPLGPRSSDDEEVGGVRAEPTGPTEFGWDPETSPPRHRLPSVLQTQRTEDGRREGTGIAPAALAWIRGILIREKKESHPLVETRSSCHGKARGDRGVGDRKKVEETETPGPARQPRRRQGLERAENLSLSVSPLPSLHYQMGGRERGVST